MSIHRLREKATSLLQNIRDELDMPPSLACVAFSQVLELMGEMHNERVCADAKVEHVFPPRVGDEEISLLREAFAGDVDPLICWLSPLVPYDPSLIYEVLPE